MKKFSVPCDFNGVKSPFTIYVGAPKEDHHPIHFQSDWLSKERGGTVPQEVMDSLAQLKDIATKNGVSFEDLCVYALGAAQQDEENDADSADTSDTADDNQANDGSTDNIGAYGQLNDSSNDNTHTNEQEYTASTNNSTDSQLDEGYANEPATDGQLDEGYANEPATDGQLDEGYANEPATDGLLDPSSTDTGTDGQSDDNTNKDSNGIRIATKKIPASDANS